MNFKVIAIVFVSLNIMASSIAYSTEISDISGYLDEDLKQDFDTGRQYVNYFLQQQDTNPNIQPADPTAQLTRLLIGIHGMELNIYFKTNSAEIDKRQLLKISKLAKVMLVYPDPMVRFGIQAHSDKRGTKSYNIALSERRLESVQNAFKQSMGDNYDSTRFYFKAHGEDFSDYTENDDYGMFLDRRVSIGLFVQTKLN